MSSSAENSTGNTAFLPYIISNGEYNEEVRSDVLYANMQQSSKYSIPLVLSTTNFTGML